MTDRAPDGTQVYSVAQLTSEIRGVLGTTFGDVWVRGEISQPRTPASGHVYLVLKDADAVLPCVIWRSTAARLRFRIEDGQEVLVRGGIDVYPPHGRYQLVIRHLEPLGEGALRLAFEQLRRRLAAEGLFDEGRKQALPPLPRRIALITSRSGAAVRDMVTVIRRRFPRVTLLLLPVRVQGASAAGEIAAALARADAQARADVVLVGRGGGSLEDLQAFNEEVVARAIAACRTPVVSAVGHETDITIADLVADVRAATPSEAGELVVPFLADLLDKVDREQTRLVHRMQVRLERAWQRVEALGDRPVLRDATGLVGPRRRGLEQLAARLARREPGALLRRRADTLASLAARLQPPIRRRVARGAEVLTARAGELHRAMQSRQERIRARVHALEDRLRALSPLSVLARGYSLTTQPDGGVVRRVADVAVGGVMHTHLGSGGHIVSRVEALHENAPEEETT